jgi:hypothetical protein
MVRSNSQGAIFARIAVAGTRTGAPSLFLFVRARGESRALACGPLFPLRAERFNLVLHFRIRVR